MFQHNFENGVELHKMMTRNPRIRGSVMILAKKIIEMIYSERFKLDTVSFNIMSPAAESNKIFITLERADYATDPMQLVKVPEETESSYKLLSFVDSLFKAICGENGELAIFIRSCNGLCDVIFAVTNYLYNVFYKYNRKDLPSVMVWTIGDGPEQREWIKDEDGNNRLLVMNDLLIYSSFAER